MPVNQARANLLIAGVVLAGVIACGLQLRAAWRELRAQGYLRSSSPSGVDPSRTPAGAKLSSRVPDWVPLYPGAAVGRISSRAATAEHYFDVELTTADHCSKVLDWYERHLGAAGFRTYGRFEHGQPGCTGTLRAEGPDRSRSIDVRTGSTVSHVAITLRSAERSGQSAATPQIPSWVPIYEGVTPAHIDGSNTADGAYRISFSFESLDEPTKVYRWCESKLKGAGFSVNFATTPGSVGSFSASTPDKKRTLNIKNFGTAPEHTYLVEALER